MAIEPDLAHLAIAVERQVNDHFEAAFNLNTLGDIQDKGTSVEALRVIAHLNTAVGIIVSFQNAILNRCNGT